MPLWQTVKLEIFKPRFFLLSILFAFTYLVLFVTIPNHKLILYSLSNFSLLASVKIILSLLVGLPRSLSSIDFYLLIFISVLVGANLSLISATLGRLKNRKVRLSVGGGTILGIVATGCSACGLSIISIFGLSAATFSFLPFMGLEFNLIAVGLLLISFFYMIYKLNEVCEIKY